VHFTPLHFGTEHLEEIKPKNKPSFKIQIYLVRSQWINGKPKQIYIGALANVKIYIDENNKMILAEELWTEIIARLNSFDILRDKQKLLIDKIEMYLAMKGIIIVKY
jgi:hypothetical protein